VKKELTPEQLERKRERGRRYAKARRDAPGNAEKFRAWQAEYRSQNREKISARRKDRYQQNREKVLTQRKESYQRQDKEKLCDKNREYYQQNEDRIKSQQAAYRLQNKEKTRVRNKVYCLQNKEKINALKSARYQRISSLLEESYIRLANRSCLNEIDPQHRRVSIVIHRVLKGEMNVEQANQIFERAGLPLIRPQEPAPAAGV
jgi:UDP-N-acetylglucosamine 2-epimerase